MKQGVLLIMGTAEAHGTYARSEIRTLLQRSMFTNVSIHHQIRSPWVPASEAATVQHPPRLIPMLETLSALWHNGPTFLPCHRPSFVGRTPCPAPSPSALLLPLATQRAPSAPSSPQGTAELRGLRGLQPRFRVCFKREM